MDHQLKKHVDENKKKNKIYSPITQFYSSKKAIQILLSVSLFSFLYSQSSQLPFLLPTFSITFFSYSTERNCIFLLCNGILFVIIKNSGWFANAPSAADFRHERHFKESENFDAKKSVQSHQSWVSDRVVSEAEAEITEANEADNDILLSQEVGEDFSTTPHHEIEDADDDEDKNDQLLQITEVEEIVEDEKFLDTTEKEEENEMLLSAEELNKKCEDFIRKMKYGIKNGGQQLIMV